MTIFAKMTTAASDMVDCTPVASGNPFFASLLMPPGNYQYDATHKWALPEGLLHVLDPGISGGYRVISAGEPYALMRAMSWLTVYGDADEGLAPATALNLMKSRKLAMRCEPTTDLCRYVAGLYGLATRKVRFLTAGTPTNFDDGHVGFELYTGGAWRLFDVAGDRYFTSNGNHVSARGYFETPPDTTVSLARSEADNDPGGNYMWHPGVYYDMFIRTPEAQAAWVNRVFQIPGIVHTDGLTYFWMPPGTETRQSWVLSLSSAFRVVDKATWVAMFY